MDSNKQKNQDVKTNQNKSKQQAQQSQGALGQQKMPRQQGSFHSTQASSHAQNSEQNITMTRRLFDEVYNKYNVSALDELVLPSVKLHDSAHTRNNSGISCLKEIETCYIKAFPNKKLKIDDIFAVEDRVVVRWTCNGVQKGPLHDIAPSNKPFTISGISIYKFANGKIAEIYQNWDRLALLEQIGEVQPAMALR